MIMITNGSDVNVTLCSPRRSSQNKETQNALLITSPKPSLLPPNHVLIRVDKFGFSANNITYEALGEHPHFRYFDFHPAPDSRYGVVPVWGFGTVVRSTVIHDQPHDGKTAIIREGERVYGYFAPTRYLSLPVAKNSISKYTFHIARPHFPPDRKPYNQIIRCDADPHHVPTPNSEDLSMIYRPLFWTAYWCEDWFHSSDYRGAGPGLVNAVVISSASAKTAFCLAYLIGKRMRAPGGGAAAAGMKVVGLTSARNLEFTRGLGLYDDVVEYAAVDEYFGKTTTKAAEERWLYVDVAGNEVVNGRIRGCLGQSLVACVKLGLTNLSPGSSSKAVVLKEKKEEEAELFFMPEWLAIRRVQLSVEEITKRQNAAWAELMRDCGRWVELERVCGVDKVLLAYERVLEDGFVPAKGCVWSMWDEPIEVRARL